MVRFTNDTKMNGVINTKDTYFYRIMWIIDIKGHIEQVVF